MELKVIRHKTAKEFFEGFYTKEKASSYAYRLERMFEQGSASEGDYFVVTENDKPLLSLEIFRNNTRRILENMPTIAIDLGISSKKYTEALTLIFDYLNEDMIYEQTQKKLEIAIMHDYEYYSELKNAISKFGYEKIIETINYTLNPKADYELQNGSYDIRKFIEFQIDDRYDLLSYSTNHGLIEDLSKEKVYLDYLEEGYQSEELWKTISCKNKMLGYMLPIHKNGFKNSIHMIDYGLTADANDLFYKAVLHELVSISDAIDLEDISIDINSSDKQFVLLANKLKLVENHKVDKFLKV